jgi:two-component system, chemotaxis family, chemotaxis protein CheY
MADNLSKRILIVDDASLVRLYYRKALEKAGFKVEEALNGLEAIERLLMAPFDLLIVDINMPQMDGLTFLKAVRAKEPPVSAIPALVTSTEAEPQRVAAATAAGANLYVTKPISEQELVKYASLLCGIAHG